LGASVAFMPPPALRGRVLEGAGRQPLQPRKVGARPDHKRRWQPRLLVAAAVAVGVAAVGVGVAVTQRPDQPPVSAAVSRVFSAPDAHQATVGTSNGGKVTVATSPRLNEMAVETDALPRLGSEQVYQIWAVHDGAMTSAAVLSNPDAGAAMEMPKPGTQVAITIEPAGGSAQPTSKPIVTVDPASV
jgi:anti-sigma-K factor RskA